MTKWFNSEHRKLIAVCKHSTGAFACSACGSWGTHLGAFSGDRDYYETRKYRLHRERLPIALKRVHDYTWFYYRLCASCDRQE